MNRCYWSWTGNAGRRCRPTASDFRNASRIAVIVGTAYAITFPEQKTSLFSHTSMNGSPGPRFIF